MNNIIKGICGAFTGILVYMTIAIVFQIIGIVDFNNETITISNYIFIGLVGLCFSFMLFSLRLVFSDAK